MSAIDHQGPDTAEPVAAAPAAPLERRWLVFGIVSIGLFMASIDQVNVMVS